MDDVTPNVHIFASSITPSPALSSKSTCVKGFLDPAQVRSVGNSAKLKQTALVELFNLKAAIELELQVGGCQ